DRIGQVQECARARRPRVVDEHIATAEALVHPVEQLLTCRERAQIAGHRERLRPSAAMILAAAVRFCSEEEASTVCAPARANASAMPRPMPRLAPEMTTILPSNSPGMFHSPCSPVETLLLCLQTVARKPARP